MAAEDHGLNLRRDPVWGRPRARETDALPRKREHGRRQKEHAYDPEADAARGSRDPQLWPRLEGSRGQGQKAALMGPEDRHLGIARATDYAGDTLVIQPDGLGGTGGAAGFGEESIQHACQAGFLYRPLAPKLNVEDVDP